MDEAADLARRSPLSPPLLAAARAGAIVALAAMSVATLHAQLVPSFAIACDARYSVALRALGRQLTLFDDGKRIRGKFNVFRTTRELYDRESYVLAAVVGGLSGVWPHLKLGAVACGVVASRGGPLRPRWHVLTYLGRFAFVDVMIVAVLVACGRFGLAYDDLAAARRPGSGNETAVEPVSVDFDFAFRSRPCRGVFWYTAAVCGSQLLCHVVLSLLVGDAAPPRRKDAAYGATDAAAPLLADGAPAWTGGDAEAPAPAGDAPAWSAEPAEDKTRGPAESREAAAPRRDARAASLAEEQLACCAAEAEEWSVGLVCVGFLAFFVALRVALGSDRAPPVLTLTEELEATLTVADLHGERYDLPAWVEQVGVSLRRSYERPLSVAGLLRDVDEPASGVAPPRRAGGLRRRAVLFAVTLPLCRVLAVFGAFLVPGRVLRYAAVAVVDALGVFAAADALVCAVFVAAVDLPNLFTHLVHDSLPGFLKEAFTFTMSVDGASMAVVAGIVAFEELFARVLARPALARAQRRDWPHDERAPPA